jgi:hypothetical protein
VAASGLHDVVQDERLDVLRQHAAGDFDARLRLLRVAARRRKGASTVLLQRFLADPDERLVRMAAREIVRRRPADMDNVLLQLMTTAGDSVRRVISRAIGQAGFEHFWTRYERLPKATRRQAGRAMLKILPDAQQRLQRRLSSGPIDQRLKAMQMTQGARGLRRGDARHARGPCTDPTPKLRSKASSRRPLRAWPPDPLVDRLLTGRDARVRANAIEVLEAKRGRAGSSRARRAGARATQPASGQRDQGAERDEVGGGLASSWLLRPPRPTTESSALVDAAAGRVVEPARRGRAGLSRGPGRGPQGPAGTPWACLPQRRRPRQAAASRRQQQQRSSRTSSTSESGERMTRREA